MAGLEDTYPALGDKIATARQAGYKDEEIQKHIRGKIQTAIKAGYSTDEVNKYLGEIRKPKFTDDLFGRAVRTIDVPRQAVLSHAAGYPISRAIEQTGDPSKSVTGAEVIEKQFKGSGIAAPTTLPQLASRIGLEFALEFADPTLLMGGAVKEAGQGIKADVEAAKGAVIPKTIETMRAEAEGLEKAGATILPKTGETVRPVGEIAATPTPTQTSAVVKEGLSVADRAKRVADLEAENQKLRAQIGMKGPTGAKTDVRTSIISPEKVRERTPGQTTTTRIKKLEAENAKLGQAAAVSRDQLVKSALQKQMAGQSGSWTADEMNALFESGYFEKPKPSMASAPRIDKFQESSRFNAEQIKQRDQVVQDARNILADPNANTATKAMAREKLKEFGVADTELPSTKGVKAGEQAQEARQARVRKGAAKSKAISETAKTEAESKIQELSKQREAQYGAAPAPGAKYKVFRSERPIQPGRQFATDPGDFGRGVYYTTSKLRAKAMGGIVRSSEISLKNPLRLTQGEAYDLAHKYGGTVTGTMESRMAAAQRMTDDLIAKGYDGIVASRIDKSGKTIEQEIVVFPDRQAAAPEVKATVEPLTTTMRPAVKVGRKVTTGDTHAAAAEKSAGNIEEYLKAKAEGKAKEGFVDAKGKFVEQKTALPKQPTPTLSEPKAEPIATPTEATKKAPDVRLTRKDQAQVTEMMKQDSSLTKAEAVSRLKKILTGEKGQVTVPVPANFRNAVATIQSRGSSYLSRDLTIRDLTKGTIREEAGKLAQKQQQVRAALEDSINRFRKADINESLAFIDSMEGPARGLNQPTAENRALAQQLADLLDERWNKVHSLGRGHLENYVQNYFPHMWSEPRKASNIYGEVFGKRPLQGKADFRKMRTIATTKEGIARGLTPVTYNPVELALLRAQTMDRYIMAHNIKDRMVGDGLAKYFTLSQTKPDGWARLDDNIFKVMQFSQKEKGLIQRGEYWAPKEAAKIFNNYLSPGWRGNEVYDIARKMGNGMNQAQLGFSGFHALFTSIDALSSDLALSLEHLTRGNIAEAGKGLARVASLYDVVKNPIVGNRLLKEYLHPGSYAAYSREAEALAKAGGRVGMDPYYKNQAIENFWKIWKEAPAYRRGAVPLAHPLKTAGMVLEYASKPIMEKLVPRQKLGVFQRMAEDILSRSDLEKWAEPKTRLELQKAWDSVDNRMGQVVYDNVFWNKAWKDLSFVGLRSFGWNLGTWRELGGAALVDLPKEIGRAATGKGFEMTHRMAYSIALPFAVGYLGGLYQFLSTGTWPQTAKDYFFPLDGTTNEQGQPGRSALPNYISKDVHSFYAHPVETTLAKLHPMIEVVREMLNNKDFWGTEIRNADDPLVKQVGDELKFVGEQFMPFSMRNARQMAKNVGEENISALFAPENLSRTGQAMVGILPTTKETMQSPAENRISQDLARHVPQGPKTQESTARVNAKRLLETQLRLGKITREDVIQAQKDGTIHRADVPEILKASRVPSIVRNIVHLDLHEVLRVWDLASDEEKALIRNEVLKKRKQLPDYPAENREDLQMQLDDVAKYRPLRKAG